MRLRLPYTRYPDGYGGSYDSVVYDIRLGADSGAQTRSFPALLDSGAGRCLFHSDLAKALGFKITSGRPEITTGIGGDQVVWVHSLLLYVVGGVIRTEAGFQEDLPIFGLLGMEGFFEHFVVTFDGLARECQLDRIYRT